MFHIKVEQIDIVKNKEEAQRQMMLTLMITLVSLLALCAAPLVLIMVCFKSNDKEDD